MTHRSGMGPNALVIAVATLFLAAGLLSWASAHRSTTKSGGRIHKNITATMFWIGENANHSNDYIDNHSSTWVENWVSAFGGIDNPDSRCNLLPCDFTPKENAFYFALPYNDLDSSCKVKQSQKEVPWSTPLPSGNKSLVKNQWIKIDFVDKTAYAQWEDAGPSGEDDTAYVFGKSPPRFWSGLDISPATASYLGLPGEGKVSWQFVSAADVPEGPWAQTATKSLPDCQ